MQFWLEESLYMMSKKKSRTFVAGGWMLALLTVAQIGWAQAAARFVGTVTAISGTSLTVKTDKDGAHQVEVPAQAVIKRISPGQRDLNTADTIQFSDLATGDRVLVKLDPEAPTGTEQALQIIAVKAADVMAKQQKDRDDWQKRGVGGLVKSIDATGGVITLTTGAGATAKTVTVRISKTTMLKRYAPASVRYDEATPAPIDAIHAGDQLRARGAKNADGSEVAAEEVVSGSFRNVSGLIVTADATAATITLKDLATKKMITIHVPADAQLRRIPDRMAQMLAIRLKGGSAASAWTGSGAGRTGGVQGGGMGNGMANGAAPTGQPGRGGTGQVGGQWAGAGSGGGDPQQFLSRAPAIQMTDLKKGDAVMVVSTDGTSEVTAITLLAGVEPLLEAPAAQNLLSSWSMGGGGAEAAAQ
jgi:hypothetical protein